jgi:hypothetical protein
VIVLRRQEARCSTQGSGTKVSSGPVQFVAEFAQVQSNQHWKRLFSVLRQGDVLYLGREDTGQLQLQIEVAGKILADFPIGRFGGRYFRSSRYRRSKG